jgi:DNA-binding NarL/FixJ family response regulator
MTSPPVETVPNVLVVSTHASFRAHVEKWLPPPAVQVIETDGTNIEQRIKEYPPQLLLIDQQLDGVRALLSRLSPIVPGLPYLVVSLEHVDPFSAFSFEIAKGYVAKEDESPTRESVIAAIAKVAPVVAARLK